MNRERAILAGTAPKARIFRELSEGYRDLFTVRKRCRPC
jgi:hypothetical protein